MVSQRLIGRLLSLSIVALSWALGLFFLFPASSSAHAVLLRSEPAKDALVATAPTQVSLWFTEDLNPATSTAMVLEVTNQAGKNTRVDNQDAHVSASDTTEMNLSLQSNLPPAAYIVIWRSQSATDGHVLT